MKCVNYSPGAGFAIEHATTHTFFPPERLGVGDGVLIAAFTIYNVLRARHPRHMQVKWRRPHLFVLARKVSDPVNPRPAFLYV